MDEQGISTPFHLQDFRIDLSPFDDAVSPFTSKQGRLAYLLVNWQNDCILDKILFNICQKFNYQSLTKVTTQAIYWKALLKVIILIL